MLFNFQTRSLSSARVLGVLGIYFTFVLNISLWLAIYDKISITGLQSAIFAFSLHLVMFTLSYVALCLFLLPYFGKPLLSLLLCISSVTNYMMVQFGIYIDSDMVRNVFETNPQEAMDLVGTKLLLWFAVFGLLPVVLLWRVKINYRPFWQEVRFRAVSAVLLLVLAVSSVALSYKDYSIYGRNNRQVRKLINTGNYIYATVRYFQQQQTAGREVAKIDINATHLPMPDNTHTVFIVVLGETSRAQNFSLGGYERKTNPRLEEEDIIYFDDVSSCGTATATSVPCIFSPLGKDEFTADAGRYNEGLMDLLQQTGYDVLWRENDGGCKGVCDRVTVEDMVAINDPEFCSGGACLDEVLLKGLEEKLRAVDKDTVIVLHTMGSHGPSYYKRYPEAFKVFGPACGQQEIQDCPKENIINTYDNTILYTDYIVSSVIDTLKKFPEYESGLLYVSDHGESLGENNVYLHGLPYSIAPSTQTHVPMLLWLSENMRKYDHLDYECLQKNAGKAYSHDNIFHSLTGLLEIETNTYKPEWDLFAGCRKPSFYEHAQ